MCQRPKRAFFISTVERSLKMKGKAKSVNALNGLSSFLLKSAIGVALMVLCQRPKRAFFISTEGRKDINPQKRGCVNALNGLSSFLPLREVNIYDLFRCVNALNGLSSFLQ